eukprot:419508-Rhodomonas_salina.1
MEAATAGSSYAGLTEEAVDRDSWDVRQAGVADLGEERGIAEDVVVARTTLGAEGVRDFVVDVAEASQEMLGTVGVGVLAVDVEVARLRTWGAEGVILSSIYSMLSEITPTTLLTDTRKK